jgi:hypothetical protein
MGNISDDIIRQIQEEINKSGENPGSVDDLNRIAARVMERHNQSAITDFDGLSPHEMYLIMNKPFEVDCPVRMNSVRDPSVLETVPVMRAAMLILAEAAEGNGIKLTPKGNLPRKLVMEIYDLDLLKVNNLVRFSPKVFNEMDYWPAAVTHALLKVAKVVTLRNSHLKLSRSVKFPPDPRLLYRSLLETFATVYHKGYLDWYDNEEIGNVGMPFVLYLLHRYGREKRETGFYAEKYFRAFPDLKSRINPTSYMSREEVARDCFISRVFEPGLSFFGIVGVERIGERYREEKILIKAEPLLYEVLEVGGS